MSKVQTFLMSAIAGVIGLLPTLAFAQCPDIVTAAAPGAYFKLGYNGTIYSQSFKASDCGVTAVTVGLAKVGSPTVNVTVAIRATLSGENLASGTITPSQVLSADHTNPTWVTVPMSVSLVPGATYYLRLIPSATHTGNHFRLPYSKVNTYTDGTAYSGTTSYTSYDFLTRVVGSTPSPSPGPTITAHFAAGAIADDAQETSGTGAMSLSGTTASIGKGYTSAFRFIGVTMPRGVTITSAHLGLYVKTGAASINVHYAAEARAHSAAFTTTASNISSRPLTAAAVNSIPPAWVNLAYNDSPDLSRVVQELVNRGDWAPGGALTITVRDNGSSSRRTIRTWDAGSMFGPRLIVTYVDPGTPAPPPPPTTSWAARFADGILTSWPDPAAISPYSDWDYTPGVVLHGMRKVYEKVPDARYLNYIRRWVDRYVDATGNLNWNTTPNLDRIQPGTLLLFLYQQTGDPRYRRAADAVRARFDTYPRNAEGGFWHKQVRPNEMLIDGIFMAEPFLTTYGRLFGDAAFCNDTAVRQTMLIASHAFDPGSSLLYHAWDQDRDAVWANPTTGLSPEFWGRGMGWFAMALVDMLDDIPPSHRGYPPLRDLLRKVVEGLARTQDPATGLWHQVLGKGGQPGNWLETSGSGMIIHAIKMAVVRGHVEASYLPIAQAGWAGLQAKIVVDPAGLPLITDTVEGMGPQVDYERYVDKLHYTNSTHGLAAVLLAAVAMEHY